MGMTYRLPNFLYIGTSKAGSTWVFDLLNRHPDVHMAPAKGLCFFSRHYERGLCWYASQFGGARGQRVVGEVSHGLLYHARACERIAKMDAGIRLMVCLREPVDRAFSDYLDARRNDGFQGSFEEALERNAKLLERGRYAKYLSRYLQHFSRDQIHVAVFDDLQQDADAFGREIFRFLHVEEIPLSSAQRKRMLPAGVPRSRRLAMLAKQGAHCLHRLGLRGLRVRLKTSRKLRNALYRPLTDDRRPSVAPDTRARLRATYRAEMKELDALLGSALATRWGYDACNED
jgi:hypothetical protein